MLRGFHSLAKEEKSRLDSAVQPHQESPRALGRFRLYAKAAVEVAKEHQNRCEPDLFLIGWASISAWASEVLRARDLQQAVREDPFELGAVIRQLRNCFKLNLYDVAYNLEKFRLYGPSVFTCLDMRISLIHEYIPTPDQGNGGLGLQQPPAEGRRGRLEKERTDLQAYKEDLNSIRSECFK